mmetsp:Transcript_118283/g.228300  ORF Transcript_118283/g.228300 Transcript_118283/m.228300 type:complete len:84 (+) Transcript_118283:1764-2015(+)
MEVLPAAPQPTKPYAAEMNDLSAVVHPSHVQQPMAQSGSWRCQRSQIKQASLLGQASSAIQLSEPVGLRNPCEPIPLSSISST